MHIIKFANTSTIPSVTNPAFRIGWVGRNFGNTTNLTVSGSSASGFIEGKVKVSTPPLAVVHDQLAVGTTLTNVIAFRNRLNFGGKRNRAEVLPLSVSLSTQSNKNAFFEILVNPVFAADVIFNYVDKAGSIMEIATDLVTVSGGSLVDARTVVAGSSEPIMFNIRQWFDLAQSPGDIFVIAARVSSGAASDMQATGTWAEDL